ncbi:MAG TPA: methyltransferase domain-containing protein [Desulfomicrobiaceae bacterium]|nr:methyltransferase domain-containing protein [Desulfomicrobiaceae bacterium]
MDEYSLFAPVYDRVLDPFLKPVQERIVSLSRERGVRQCVDLCCGTGALACRLGRAGVSCLGVDLSRDMLVQAEQKHCSGVRFLRSDAADSGLAEESFELATICFALHEKPEPLRHSILAEALRLLVPGGLLVVVDYSGPGRGWWPVRTLAATVERVAGPQHYRNFREYMDRGGLGVLLRQCNIESDRTELFHGGVTSMTTSKKPATA